MKTVMIAVGIVVLLVFLAGGIFVFHLVRTALDAADDAPKMPDALSVAKVVSGDGLFAKAIYYKQPDLGVITDIERTQTREPLVVGHSGAAFLSEDLSASRKVQFDRCDHDVVFSELAGGSFLCRGSWNTGVSLIGLDGKTLWPYGGFPIAPDDAAAGVVGADGAKGVVVGFPGGGGVRFISPEGKELWRQTDGNVWHVEIAASGDKAGNVIVHSNVAGKITLRDATGTVLGRYQPEIYLGDFSLTAWKDDPLQDKLIAAKRGYFYVFALDGKTVARLSAAEVVTDTAGAKGVPIHLSKDGSYYAALVRYPLWDRSVLYIYDEQDRPVYSEIFAQNCAALSSIKGPNSNDDLLLGCDGMVWKYSQSKPPKRIEPH
jgi:hypothetical protein